MGRGFRCLFQTSSSKSKALTEADGRSSCAVFSPVLKCGLEAHLLKVSETVREEASGKQTRSVGDSTIRWLRGLWYRAPGIIIDYTLILTSQLAKITKSISEKSYCISKIKKSVPTFDGGQALALLELVSRAYTVRIQTHVLSNQTCIAIFSAVSNV